MMNYIKLIFLLGLLLLTPFAAGNFSNADKQFFVNKNILLNPGFEQGKTNWRTNSGSFSLTTTAANIASGASAASFTSSAANIRLGSSLVTVPAGLYNRNCLLTFSYKGGDDKYIAAVDTGSISGSSLAYVTLSSQTTYKKESLSFICPSSGQLSAAIYTTGSSSNAIYLDDFYLGENHQVGQASQASFAGSAYFETTTNCTWPRQDATIGAFSSDTDCPGPTIASQKIGEWQTTDANLPRLTINNLPPGNYQLVATLHSSMSAASSPSVYALTDGTTTVGYTSGVSAAGDVGDTTIVGNFEYTTSGNRTFEVHGRSDGVAVTEISMGTSNKRLTFSLYRFPSTQETVLRVDQAGWFVDGNVYGGEPSLGTTSVSTYTGITDSALQLELNSGSLTAQIPCSGGNASSGLTCSAGNEYIGISYVQPTAGPVEACASFTHYRNLAVNSTVVTAFQVVETANTSDTIVLQGNIRINTGSITGGSSLVTYSPVEVCGNFNFTTAGQKTLKLMYEQNTSGTLNTSVVLANRTAPSGQEDVHWRIKPIAQASTMPLITNSVSTSSTGQLRVEAANLNCDAGSAITSQNGSWVSSIGNISSGKCAVTFATGAFSSAPYCTASNYSATNDRFELSVSASTTSGVSLGCYSESGAGNCTAFDAHLLCVGAK